MSTDSRKVITVSATGVSSGAICPEYVNLMPDASGALVPFVPASNESSSGSGPRPLVDFCTDEGQLIKLYSRGREVGELIDGEFSTIATVHADLQCALQAGQSVVLMTADGPRLLLSTADGWLYIGSQPDWPGVKFVAVTAGQICTDIPATDISGIDMRAATLAPAAVSQLSRTLLDAYSRLADDASASGLFVQPVVARYVVRGVGGHELFRSGPVVVALPGGWQCCSAVETGLTSAAENAATLASIRLEAEAYRIMAIVEAVDPASPWSKAIAAIEIQISPQLHPVDFSGHCEWRIEGGSSQSPVLRLGIPGATHAFAPYLSARARTVDGVVGRLDHLLSIVSRALPISTTAIRPLERPAHGKTAEEYALLQAVLKRPVSYTAGEFPASLLRRCSPPHSFAAGAVCESGDVVVWADITPLWFRGYDPRLWACDTADGEWRMSVSVLFYDDTERVAAYECEGSGGCPVTLSPLLSYPDPEARQLTIYLEHDDTVVTRSFNLTPAPDGSCAYYADPSLLPISLGDAVSVPSFISVDHTRRDRNHAAALIAAPKHSPLLPGSALECGSAPVCAVMPAVRSQSSWDFARTHLYAFSASGIYAVAIHSSRRLAAATMIDPRGVGSAADLVYHSDGILALTTAGEMLRVAGARAIEVAVPEAVATDASGLIKWSVRMPVGHRRAVRCLRLDMSASQFDGTLCVSADDGAGAAHSLPVLSLSVCGQVNAPLFARFAMPARCMLTVSLVGTASSDFRLSALYLF